MELSSIGEISHVFVFQKGDESFPEKAVYR